MTSPRPRTTTALARTGLTVGALVLGLAACSDDEPDVTEQSSPEVTAQERLDEAAQYAVDSGSFRLDLVADGVPEGTNEAILAANGSGSVDPPAFDGTVTARISGVQAEVPVVALDGELHVQLPYTSSFATVTPESLGVIDPAILFSADRGVTTLLGTTEDAEYGEQTRDGADILRQVTGTLPGGPVLDILGVGASDAAFDATFGLVESEDEPWQVRTVTLAGPFYPDGDSTYVLTLDQYGEPVDIEAP